VRLTLTDPAGGIGPLRASATQGEGGRWLAGPITLPTAGPWEVRITLLIDDFTQVSVDGLLAIPESD